MNYRKNKINLRTQKSVSRAFLISVLSVLLQKWLFNLNMNRKQKKIQKLMGNFTMDKSG